MLKYRSATITRYRITICSAAILLLGPIMPLASNGTVMLLLIASLSVLNTSALRSCWKKTPKIFWLGLLLLTSWILISNIWTPEPNIWKSIKTILVILGGISLVAGIQDLKKADKNLLRTISLWSLGIMTGIFAFEFFSNSKITHLLTDPLDAFALERVARGVVLLAALLVPTLVYMLQTRSVVGGILLITSAIIVLLLPMTAASIGLFSGLLVLLLTHYIGRPAIIVLTIIFSIYALTAPLLSSKLLTINNIRNIGFELESSKEHRIGIWSYASIKALQIAPKGAGFDSSRVIGRSNDQVEEMRKPNGHAPEALPLHPHNAVLQTWLELGLVGIVGLILMTAGITNTIARLQNRIIAAGCNGVLAATMAPLLLSFGLWQAWWLATLGFIAALTIVVLDTRKQTATSNPSR